MKSITFKATEYVHAWYETDIHVTADDVRAYIAEEIETRRKWYAGKDASLFEEAVVELQEALSNFEDDPYHTIWEEVASEKYGEKRPHLRIPIQEDSQGTEYEISNEDGWGDGWGDE